MSAAEEFDRFTGTNKYIVSESLRNAVNVSVALGRPLLVKGEPGTGKTLLAHNIAVALGKQLLIWNIKSTTKAQEGLYVYDTVQRLNDSRFGGKDISDIKQYIKLGQLGKAFSSPEQVVLLLDEVDKADFEFPNDLLNELDEMSFYIVETGERIAARHRPIVVITSNSEKELPDAFLRRCIFHYIEFPSPEMMRQIVAVHFPTIADDLVKSALERFYALRQIQDLRKKPSTSELLDWLQALVAGGVPADRITSELPFVSALIKKEQDLEAVLGRRSPTMASRGYYR